jgi:hypothetical protein
MPAKLVKRNAPWYSRHYVRSLLQKMTNRFPDERPEALAATLLKIKNLHNVIPCRLVGCHRRFGGSLCFHFQGWHFDTSVSVFQSTRSKNPENLNFSNLYIDMNKDENVISQDIKDRNMLSEFLMWYYFEEGEKACHLSTFGCSHKLHCSHMGIYEREPWNIRGWWHYHEGLGNWITFSQSLPNFTCP